MRSNALLPLLAVLSLLSLPSACSDTTASVDGPVAFDRGLDRSRPDTAPRALFCGSLVDETGAPVAKGDVIICIGTDVCLSGAADDTGAFCVAGDLPGEYFFHAPEKTVGGKRLGDAVFPVSLSAGEVSSWAQIELGTVVKPVISKSAVLDVDLGGTLDFGGGAKLTVAAKTGECALFKTCDNVGLAEVPIAKIHPRLLASRSGNPTPVLAYLLVPYDLSFSAPASFEAMTPFSASPVTLDAYHANTETGKLEAMGQATVVNGKLTKALPALGWWLFYARP